MKRSASLNPDHNDKETTTKMIDSKINIGQRGMGQPPCSLAEDREWLWRMAQHYLYAPVYWEEDVNAWTGEPTHRAVYQSDIDHMANLAVLAEAEQARRASLSPKERAAEDEARAASRTLGKRFYVSKEHIRLEKALKKAIREPIPRAKRKKQLKPRTGTKGGKRKRTSLNQTEWAKVTGG